MIDLAYTALIYGNATIAKEVIDLEEDMNQLRTEYELSLLEMKKKPGEERWVVGLLRLGSVAEKLSDAAGEIADVVCRGLNTHPVVRIAVEEAEESVTLVEIKGKSPLTNKKISELRLEDKLGVYILAIKRGKTWRYSPTGKEEIKPGDVIIAKGYKESLDIFEDMARKV